MTTEKTITPDDALFAGGEPDATPVVGDRGDLVVPVTPAPVVPAPVVEPTPAVEPVTPAAEATPEPAPVVEPAAPAVEPVEGEPPVRNRRDFKERLAVKNNKIAILEAELAAARATAPAAPTTPLAAPTTPEPAAPKPATAVISDVQALRLKSMQLMMEGKIEEAAAVQGQADQILLAHAADPEALRTLVLEQVKQQQAEQTLDEVTQELVTDYSFLDSDSNDYDETITIMINAVARRNAAQGQTAAQALRMAANEVLPRVKPELFTPDGAPAPAVVPPVAPAAPTPAPAPAPAPRKPDPVKSVQNAAAQPPIPVPAGGVVPVTIDVFALDETQFNTLTQAQLSALRGDNL
jgi:hypothetical protein